MPWHVRTVTLGQRSGITGLGGVGAEGSPALRLSCVIVYVFGLALMCWYKCCMLLPFRDPGHGTRNVDVTVCSEGPSRFSTRLF